ncbi:sensor histidine kinase RegB [Frigidibacter sp. ROC022]|uniref:sensor histidine kinase RegB n=1 Tax=Frigidibacter sp. ROC022 TaxID=2971796 RepID=UPI00215A2473|nr:ActS/PrrB/RegB family redox-sensitive histidine kinase [Frigidibacter sp. ROC022]MCR8724494.1 ActS/PrrB/RegB family redox-sensitive histidine kinase [Frigidibacter sp. ROC022]
MKRFSPEAIRADRRGDWVRLRTLIVVRWIAIGGQLTALLIAQTRLGIDVEMGACVALIALSALVNMALTLVFPVGMRMTEPQVTTMLLFDMTQLMALVALNGGLDNPFALLVLAPVTISATALPLRQTLIVAGAAVALTTLAVNFNLPLRTMDGVELHQNPLLTVGFWIAILVGIGFVSLYARRVSVEIHLMSDALLATQMALAREQKLTDLGGVVAATAHELGTPLATIKLASAEMIDELADRPELAEDARLIRDQADRCRDILRSMGRAGKRDNYLARAPLIEVLREAGEPHLSRGKTVEFSVAEGLDPADQPLIERRPELIHGVRNLIQNAVDFANSAVCVQSDWSRGALRLRICDDGPGYPAHLIGHLGEPSLRRRERAEEQRPEYEGMGLGLFIAKTLLERTGADVTFMNDPGTTEGGLGGALVSVEWPANAGLIHDPGLRPQVETNPHISS